MGLGLHEDDANDQCRRLLETDPKDRAERERLLREEQTLQAGKAQLADLMGRQGFQPRPPRTGTDEKPECF